jgi:LytS/YehU family sensor histidine kinase
MMFVAYGTAPFAALRAAVATVLPWAVLGLPVLNVPQRVPWNDRRRSSFFLWQLALAFVYGALSTLGWMGLRALEAYLFADIRALHFPLLALSWQTIMGGLLYGSVAGVGYALWSAERSREAAERAVLADSLRARAELAALRSQLNPHFLLNTLHVALGLVRRDPSLAEQALERLGELMHYGLRMHRDAVDHVSLREEWGFVQSYLQIETLRLEERLKVSLDAEPLALSCLVPPFVLQPLVENAVLHAVAPRKEGGRVEISARCCGDRLRLEVLDDGPGLPEKPLPSRQRLGLQLLRDRLALLYEGRASLLLEPQHGPGLRAIIDLPLNSDASAESE